MQLETKWKRIFISVIISVISSILVYLAVIGILGGYSIRKNFVDLFTLSRNFGITLVTIAGVLGLLFGLISKDQKRAFRLGVVAGIISAVIYMVSLIIIGPTQTDVLLMIIKIV